MPLKFRSRTGVELRNSGCAVNFENTEKFFAAYPLLYRNLRDRQFECGDGWFDLVWKLSAEIESAAHSEVIHNSTESWPSVSILKQKCGELRVSFSFPVKVSDGICALATKASESSALVCEECGAVGKSWRATCKPCRKGNSSE